MKFFRQDLRAKLSALDTSASETNVSTDVDEDQMYTASQDTLHPSMYTRE